MNTKVSAERRGGGTYQGLYWAMADGRNYRLVSRCDHKHKSRRTAEACAKKKGRQRGT
jgi:hypothetical protein